MKRYLDDLPPTMSAELHDDVCVAFLNRPEKRNAVDLSIIHGLKLLFAHLDGSPVKGLVIAGRGDHFCAGLDLNELREYDAEEGMRHSLSHHEAFRAIQYAPVPVVCVLHGATIGAGLEIASAAHLRVAERSAYYGLPEGQRGIFLGGGGSVRISRLVGVSRVRSGGRDTNTYPRPLTGSSRRGTCRQRGISGGREATRRCALARA